MPDDAGFATKTELARKMLARALDIGVPAARMTADEAYGKDHKFRAWLEQRRIGYAVAVACNQAIPTSGATWAWSRWRQAPPVPRQNQPLPAKTS